MAQTVAIIDYSSGNLHSVYKKLSALKARPLICHSAKDLEKVDKIILPGVGHFGAAMNSLKNSSLYDALQHEVMNLKKPTLGICLGMQLMANQSEEAPGCDGLNWVEAKVVRFKHHNAYMFRTPHTGWNDLLPQKKDAIIDNVSKDDALYFTHSYHLVCNNKSIVIAETDYEYRFASVIRNEHLIGVQFHPEKSHAAGEVILKNFLAL